MKHLAKAKHSITRNALPQSFSLRHTGFSLSSRRSHIHQSLNPSFFHSVAHSKVSTTSKSYHHKKIARVTSPFVPLSGFAMQATQMSFASSASVAKKREERKKEQRTEWLKEASKGLPTFAQCLAEAKQWPLKRAPTTTLQVNIGLLCNQTCHHCHVESGPTRKKENMDEEKVKRLLYLLDKTPSIHTVDITGGAPELNPYFRTLVEGARERGKTVLDRCNLTVLLEPGQEDLSHFLAKHKVNIVASLPCYSPANVDKQRGKGVFDKSITALQQLNSLGYGVSENLPLHLVYNPVGPHLPPPQPKLEADYKRELKQHLDITFNGLFTITNMPIKRYADFLFQAGEYSQYMTLLVNNFNRSTVEGLMCRHLVNISWDGTLYDCDFNQQLEIPLGAVKFDNELKAKMEARGDGRLTIWDVESLDFTDKRIAVDSHCFGCTAGAGSSCTGALADE